MTKLDDGLRLDINKLVRDGYIQLGAWYSGQLTWCNAASGEQVGSIGYENNTLDTDNMWLRLHYTLTPCFSSESEKRDYKIRLVYSRPHYGGKRLWFLCPVTGRKASVLYSSGGAQWFASRHAYRVGYRSQSRGVIDRAIDRMWRLKNKLGGEDFFIRPKGMHTRTHERMMEDVFKAEEKTDSLLGDFIRKIGALDDGALKWLG